MKLYMHPISQPSRAVLWACKYEGTAFEPIVITPPKETRTEAYLKQSPLGGIPRLDDDGFILSEGHAIMVYLGDRFGWSLFPKDPQIRARIHEYVSWHLGPLRNLSLAFFVPAFMPDAKRDAGAVKFLETTALAAVGTLEKLLSRGTAWLCCDQPTIADLMCYCEVGQCLDQYVGVFEREGVDMKQYPKLVEWLKRCQGLRCYKEVHEALLQASPMFKENCNTVKKMNDELAVAHGAKSGNGTLENVGIKTQAVFSCKECIQKFDTERANLLHWKFIHDPNRHQED